MGKEHNVANVHHNITSSGLDPHERQKNVSVEHMPQFGSRFAFTWKKEPNIPHSPPVSKEVTSLTKVTITTLNENDDKFSTANNAFNEDYSSDHSNETLLHRRSDRNNACETCDGDPSRDQKTLEEDDNESVQKEHYTELEVLNHHTAESASNTSTESEISRYDRLSWSFTVVAWVMCLVTVILMILIALEYGSQSQTAPQPEFHSITGSADNKSDCLPCLQLILDPYNPNDPDPFLDKLTKKWEDGDLMCCAETQEQMAVLWEAVMRPWKTTAVSPLKSSTVQVQSRGPVSAKKSLLEPDRSAGLNYTSALMNPNFNDLVREHVHGVTVTNTSMIIRYSGYYHVYISVLYGPNPYLKGKNLIGQPERVYILQYNSHRPSTTGCILELSFTPTAAMTTETVFSGGVFLLKEGDHIQVHMMGITSCKFSKESTYLGLFLEASDNRI